MAERQKFGIERPARESEKTGFEGPVVLERADAREPPVDVVVGAEHGGDTPEHVRLVALEPAQLGRDQLLIDAVAGALDEGGGVGLGRELGDLAAGAAIALLDAAPEQATSSVEQDDRR